MLSWSRRAAYSRAQDLHRSDPAGASSARPRAACSRAAPRRRGGELTLTPWGGASSKTSDVQESRQSEGQREKPMVPVGRRSPGAAAGCPRRRATTTRESSASSSMSPQTRARGAPRSTGAPRGGPGGAATGARPRAWPGAASPRRHERRAPRRCNGHAPPRARDEAPARSPTRRRAPRQLKRKTRWRRRRACRL